MYVMHVCKHEQVYKRDIRYITGISKSAYLLSLRRNGRTFTFSQRVFTHKRTRVRPWTKYLYKVYVTDYQHPPTSFFTVLRLPNYICSCGPPSCVWLVKAMSRQTSAIQCDAREQRCRFVFRIRIEFEMDVCEPTFGLWCAIVYWV